MNREDVIDAIRQAAETNGGVVPGMRQFEKLTGINASVWRGKFWLRWSEAVSEAGLSSGQMNVALDNAVVLARLAGLTRKRGRFPTYSELLMERTGDKTFPTPGVFDRLGDQPTRISLLREFAKEHTAFADVVDLLPAKEGDESSGVVSGDARNGLAEGYVYMLKLGKHYKIGKTFSVPRRHREIALELPQKPDVVHSIRTDDPEGIESYWHRRFQSMQTNGEWFALGADDVRAFKRRKFM